MSTIYLGEWCVRLLTVSAYVGLGRDFPFFFPADALLVLFLVLHIVILRLLVEVTIVMVRKVVTVGGTM